MPTLVDFVTKKPITDKVIGGDDHLILEDSLSKEYLQTVYGKKKYTIFANTANAVLAEFGKNPTQDNYEKATKQLRIARSRLRSKRLNRLIGNDRVLFKAYNKGNKLYEDKPTAKTAEIVKGHFKVQRHYAEKRKADDEFYIDDPEYHKQLRRFFRKKGDEIKPEVDEFEIKDSKYHKELHDWADRVDLKNKLGTERYYEYLDDIKKGKEVLSNAPLTERSVKRFEKFKKQTKNYFEKTQDQYEKKKATKAASDKRRRINEYKARNAGVWEGGYLEEPAYNYKKRFYYDEYDKIQKQVYENSDDWLHVKGPRVANKLLDDLRGDRTIFASQYSYDWKDTKSMKRDDDLNHAIKTHLPYQGKWYEDDDHARLLKAHQEKGRRYADKKKLDDEFAHREGRRAGRKYNGTNTLDHAMKIHLAENRRRFSKSPNFHFPTGYVKKL